MKSKMTIETRSVGNAVEVKDGTENDGRGTPTTSSNSSSDQAREHLRSGAARHAPPTSSGLERANLNDASNPSPMKCGVCGGLDMLRRLGTGPDRATYVCDDAAACVKRKASANGIRPSNAMQPDPVADWRRRVEVADLETKTYEAVRDGQASHAGDERPDYVIQSEDAEDAEDAAILPIIGALKTMLRLEGPKHDIDGENIARALRRAYKLGARCVDNVILEVSDHPAMKAIDKMFSEYEEELSNVSKREATHHLSFVEGKVRAMTEIREAVIDALRPDTPKSDP